jgi:hypothetical protein
MREVGLLNCDDYSLVCSSTRYQSVETVCIIKHVSIILICGDYSLVSSSTRYQSVETVCIIKHVSIILRISF